MLEDASNARKSYLLRARPDRHRARGGAVGFGGVAGTAMSGAHLLIWMTIVIVIVGVVFALIRRA